VVPYTRRKETRYTTQETSQPCLSVSPCTIIADRNLRDIEAQPEKKEGLFDKIFHHHKHEEGQQATRQQAGQAGQAQQPVQKESKIDKFKDYIKEDKELEREGKEYGGLM
jgi:uncharacterized membrane-anchored protein YjiN (DUF445 family)